MFIFIFSLLSIALTAYAVYTDGSKSETRWEVLETKEAA